MVVVYYKKKKNYEKMVFKKKNVKLENWGLWKLLEGHSGTNQFLILGI